MVRKGQFLERPAIIAAGELFLEGLYHRGDRPPGLLVCPPGGAEAGMGMDTPPIAELAFACARASLASLRFQHRGVGASQGSFDPAEALADAEFAYQHLADTAGPLIAVAGYLSGCRTALALARARPHVRKVVLLAPDRLEPFDDLRAPVQVVLPGDSPLSVIDGFRQATAGGKHTLRVVEGADVRFLRGLPGIADEAIGWLVGERNRAEPPGFRDE